MKYLLIILLLSSAVSCQKKTDTLNLEGLIEPVEVYYDNYGIPHINAQNNKDMMFALGYTMASDRLFQMDLLRRIGSGRLSEVFGEKTFEPDKLLRTLGIRKQMNENWKKFKRSAPKEMLEEIDAFMEGLNLYIKEGPKPMELKLLRYKIEPFSIVDSLSVAGYMGLNFAESLIVDVMYTDLLDEVSSEDVELIFSRGYKDDKIASFHANNYKPSDEYYALIGKSLSTLLDQFTLFHGSNAFALSPKRSKSGKAILANDPHIGFGLPSVWYEAHIKSPSYESYGHYIPLIPYPGLSHNKDRAWGITMAKFNEMDVYQETFHPDDKNLVLYKGSYVKVKNHTEIIKVKGEKDYSLEVRNTPHGPVLDETKHGKLNKGLSLEWQFLSPENNPALALYLLSKSKDIEDLAPALKHATSPSFMFTFADSKGNIGWHVMGRIPVLPNGFNGKYILDGASGAQDYNGYLNIEENPHLYNPESGMIAMANQKPLIKTKKNINGMWLSSQRQRRLHTILSGKEKWSAEELKKVQTDKTVYDYDNRFKKHIQFIEPKNKTEKKALSLLLDWDGVSDIEKPQTTIYYAIKANLIKNILLDELGKERLKEYTKITDTYTFLNLMLQGEKSKLWDVKGTEKIETREDIIQKSFQDSIKFLIKKFGSRIENWSWGRAHTLTFNHSLGKVFPLNLIFNLGPYPAHGGGGMVSNFGGDKADLNFDVIYGPSTRRIIDFADPENSFGVLPTGNSGDRFSKHYKDQIRLFFNNEYRPQLLNFKDIKQVSKKRTYRPFKELNQ